MGKLGLTIMYYALFVELDVFFDVSVYYPQTSQATPSYPLPPPTTLVGSLAYPLNREKGVLEVVTTPEEQMCSSAVKLLDDVHYATSGSLGYVTYKSLERIHQHLYMRKEHWKHIDLAWSVAPRGGSTFLDDKLYVLYITKNPELASYAWGITRIGRKESHVIVRDVNLFRLEDLATEKLEESTYFYVPATIIHSCTNYIEVNMPTLSRENYCAGVTPRTEKFYVPMFHDSMKCELDKDKGIFIRIKDMYVPIPKEFISSLK